MRYLAAQHRDLAVELFTRVPDSRKGAVLGEFARAFGPHGALAWKDLAKRHKDAFLDALGGLGRYHMLWRNGHDWS
ncbi:MAG TPA: hypothetical protein VIV12_26405 [Streptosporangiaceae bacterium]